MADEAPKPPFDVKRHENFEYWYSNNFQFQPTESDLTIIFGQVDTTSGKPVIEQHTAMTLTWEQAKLLAHFLRVQVAGREMLYGRLQIPPPLWPSEPVQPTADFMAQNPQAEGIIELFRRMREEFIATIR